LASPEAVSWIGFITFGIALIGAAGLFLLSDKLGKLHKSLGGGLAVLAACGYAIERIGDAAIIARSRALELPSHRGPYSLQPTRRIDRAEPGSVGTRKSVAHRLWNPKLP
jgi:hypothetical protein